MSDVNVIAEYKDTEVGIIPKDWEAIAIGEALTIKHGKDQKGVESISGKYPIFGTGGQMGWATAFLYDKPSVLIGRKGSINKPRYINVPFWTVDTLFYSQVHNGYDEKFMFYKFCLIDWTKYNEASGVPSLNARTISNVQISAPKKREQTAIATALSDVDNLIQSLERLVSKKEAIKTATMQQLLTGKTRLPEFATREDGNKKGFKQTDLGQIPEDWELVSVRETCDLLTGFPFPSSKYQDSGIRLLRGSNVKRGNTDWSDNITKFWAESTSGIEQYLLQEADVVISMDGSLVGRSFAQLSDSDLPALLLQRVARLRAKLISQNYLKEWICSPIFSDYCDSVKTVTAIPHISPADILNFRFFTPQSKKEQIAIATTLSDMDTEIQALHTRLTKTQDIKQGMMQQLLTGQVRLVSPSDDQNTHVSADKGNH